MLIYFAFKKMCLKNNRSDRPVIKNAPVAEYRRSPTEGVNKRVAVAQATGPIAAAWRGNCPQKNPLMWRVLLMYWYLTLRVW